MYQNPKRLERMLCSLKSYDLKVKWKPGPQLLIADHLSRAPVKDQTSEFEEIVDEIHAIDHLDDLPMSEKKVSEY